MFVFLLYLLIMPIFVCFSEWDHRQRHVSGPRGSWGLASCTQSVLAHTKPRQTLRQSPQDSRAGQQVCPESLKATLPRMDPEAIWATIIPSSRFTNTALAVNNNSWECWGYILSVRMHTKSGVLYIYTDMVEWELTRFCVILLEIKPIIQGSLTAWCSIICSSQIHPSDWLAMQSSTLIPDRNMQYTAAILQSL